MPRPPSPSQPVELERQPYDDFDIAVIRALQGDMPVIAEPYAPAAAELGIPQARLLDHLAGMQERGLLRRVAAILYHRRAGFSANGMGVWKVPDEQILAIGGRMASFRGISHCYQRPTYEDWPYSVFTMAHGRSKEECDAILDAIARGHGHRRARDPLLLDRVQEDPAPLLHRRVQGVGTGARAGVNSPSIADTKSAELYHRATSVLPGGVNSPVRAMRAIGRDPLFIERGDGAEIIDVDGNRYIDWVCSWGPLIHGHAHPEIIEAVVEAAADGDELRRADRRRGRARRGGRPPDDQRADAAHDLLGHRGDDERDAPRARGHRPRASC